MSRETKEIIRCDLGGEYRDEAELVPGVEVNGIELDVCTEHAAERSLADTLSVAADLAGPGEAADPTGE